MRWKSKDTPLGAERVRFGFLFFPVRIQGEWRWLEDACWFERYVGMDKKKRWAKIEWLDDWNRDGSDHI